MNIINQRFGLRKLLYNNEYKKCTNSLSETDLTFEPRIREELKIIAKELIMNPSILFDDQSTLEERKASWKALLEKKVDMDIPLDSRSRPGHVLIDYHMPHFWSVRNWKGISVKDLASDPDILYKALWANLKMHSTPYSSEIRRSLCMVGGLSNVTKYRAPLAKAIIEGFGAKSVLDPCAGWGGRMLGALAAGAKYTGCEPCLETVSGLERILKEIDMVANIIAKPAEDGLIGLSGFDMVLTSPPYFNLEKYSSENTQSISSYDTWDKWLIEWLDPIITLSLSCLVEGGTSCWSVKNFKTNGTYNLADEVIDAHKRLGWTLVRVVKMVGSSRPGEGRIKDGEETRRSEEETFCFKRS